MTDTTKPAIDVAVRRAWYAAGEDGDEPSGDFRRGYALGKVAGRLGTGVAALTAAAENAAKAEPANKEPRDRDDPLGRFLSQCMIDDIGHVEKARDMYGAYLDWCRDQDILAYGEIRFRRELAAEGFQRADEHLCAYRDVRLKDKAGGEDG